jgi:class 3 adenylate cyclase
MDTAIHPSSGMRREVAVLFVDISGFSRLVERFDPEVVYQVVRPLLDQLVLLVQRYDGEIQQVLGDGFMSTFGLRHTVGNEAEQAVRASLALVSAGAGTDHPPVHVGVEYGEVLVTPPWHAAGYGVWGRPVNLAKRLCDLAGPGEVQVGPAAFLRARHHLDEAEPARIRVKGITRRVDAHRIALHERRPLVSVR